LTCAREGVRLEPHSANSRAAVAWPLISAGRYDEAVAELAAAVALGGSPFALWSYGTALSAVGRHGEAIAAHREAVQLTGGGYSHYEALLANALAQDGQAEEARSILRRLEERAAREYVPPFDRAVVLAGLGEDEAALEALERAVEERNAFLWARIHFPQLRRLADLPRFRAIADQLGRRAPVGPRPP
jgi:tetratricopeptide (TPR) repeat protein